MPGYARLVKVKAREAKWKKRAKVWERQAKDMRTVLDMVRVESESEIERLNGILANMLPTGTVGGRIKQLETTNEFLEGKTKHQEARIKELEQAYQGAYAEVKRLKRLIVDKDRRISSLEPAFSAAASDADKYADRVNELESALAAEVAKAIELHQAHATKVQRIKVLEAKETEQHELLARHARELESRAEKITLLYEEIGEMGKTIASQTDLLLMAQKQIRDLQDELGDKDESAAGTIQRVKELQADVTNLEKRNQYLEEQIKAKDMLLDSRGLWTSTYRPEEKI